MSANFLIQKAKEIQIVIDANAPEIEKLDQEIGDGDHIFNVQRGIKLVIELEPTIKDPPAFIVSGLSVYSLIIKHGFLKIAHSS